MVIKKEKIIELENISKSYQIKNRTIEVLSEIGAEFVIGKTYVIMGKSGSGKSTFINILGLIETDYDGTYKLFNLNPKNLKDKELSNLRMKHIGFIFQKFELSSELNAVENVMIPMLINNKIAREDRKNRAIKLLEEVGLGNRINHFPNELSGGEQQRVAIARALANDPSIILADEPTGNLDEEYEAEIFETLKKMAQMGKCVIIVSHSSKSVKYADQLYKMIKGQMVLQDEEY